MVKLIELLLYLFSKSNSMKKYVQHILNTGIALFFLLPAVSSTAQNLDNPGAYMGAVNNAQTEMNQKYMAYMSAVAHGRRAKKIEKMRQQTLESITNARY